MTAAGLDDAAGVTERTRSRRAMTVDPPVPTPPPAPARAEPVVEAAVEEEFAGLDVEEVIAHGEAASEIVRVAKDRGADLIVLSSHGRAGLGRIIFGSTAESVVRHAHCPVLVVKPPAQ